MVIIKIGHTPGFRGRLHMSNLGRRAYYLAAEHGRDSAVLLDSTGRQLEPEQAIEYMGGPQVEYHEVIVAPSRPECEAIWARNPENRQLAQEEAGLRLAQAYAQGRTHLLAIHEQDGRFHYHIAVSGPVPAQALGRHGQIQKHWDREFLGDEPRIKDWEAHQRFKSEKARLQEIIQQQRLNEIQRREAVRKASSERKSEVARPFEQKARQLIELRYAAELAAIQARYEARGSLGSPRHQAEIQGAEHRRTGALNRLEKREIERNLHQSKHLTGRALDQSGRVLQNGSRLAGSMAKSLVDRGLQELGVPAPLRSMTRATLACAQEALQASLRASLEASKAAARSSIHLAQATLNAGVGLAAALPSGGASLGKTGEAAGRELASAGKEMGQGAARVAAEIGKGAIRAVSSSSQELMPKEFRLAARVAYTAAKTTVQLAQDVATFSPWSVGKTLTSAGLELSQTASSAAKQAPLPEPLRRAYQLAGWVPVVGIAAKAAELATQTLNNALNAASRGPEVER